MQSERIEVSSSSNALQLSAWEVGDPGPEEVRVRVHYAGVSFGDVMLQRHVFRKVPSPAVPGYDVVGVIDRSDDPTLPPGTRVAAFLEYGGYARHALVPKRSLVVLPEGVEESEVAAIVLNYSTADQLIERARLCPGDPILVFGIKGGVGSAIADLAARAGARVFGTARGGHTASTIDPSAPDFTDRATALAPEGFAAVFDGRGVGAARSHALVRRGGTFVVFGLSGASDRSLRSRLRFLRGIASILWLRLRPRGRRTEVFAIDQLFHKDPVAVRELVARQVARLADHQVSPVVGEILPLAEAAKAHALLERGGVTGKIVLRVA